MAIHVGKVVRWFNIDWEFFGNVSETLKNSHDDILDALMDMPNAVEAETGHTGVNVAFENSKLTDARIVAELVMKLSKFVNSHN